LSAITFRLPLIIPIRGFLFVESEGYYDTSSVSKFPILLILPVATSALFDLRSLKIV